MSIHKSIHLYALLLAIAHMSMYISIHMSTPMSIYISIHMSTHMSIYISAHMPIHTSIHLRIHLCALLLAIAQRHVQHGRRRRQRTRAAAGLPLIAQRRERRRLPSRAELPLSVDAEGPLERPACPSTV